MRHHVIVHEQSNGYVLACSCDWHGFVRTLDRADRWVASHVSTATDAGQEVIIERDMLDKPTVVDGREE